MSKFFTAACIFFYIIIQTAAQTFPVKTIIENGPRDKRINVVFLGDGYQEKEMEKYVNDVTKTVASIFNESPYKEYKDLFNVYAVEVPSNESGTDHPGTAADCPAKDQVFKKDTYFNTSFDYEGIHRLLATGDNVKINIVLRVNVPDYDMVFMIVNHEWYGGSGGALSVFSCDALSSELALHEAGHSFGNLADEYGGTSWNKYNGINVTYETDREKIRWNPWILPATPVPTPLEINYFDLIGSFEGAYYSDKGMYRPKVECKMRVIGAQFCEVCKEQHVKKIFSLVSIIDSFNPAGGTITIGNNDKQNFTINILPLISSETNLEWKLDSIKVADNINQFLFDASGYSLGKHTLEVTANYNTPLVRNDIEKYLHPSRKWIIDIKNSTDVRDDSQIPTENSLSQNFPNPFNPETIISYKLQSVSYVTLKIYNSLGSEVATLVNETKQPGVYNSIFNIVNYSLPSGVYFYTLTTGNFSATRKMMILK